MTGYTKWYQIIADDGKWYQMRPNAIKWYQMIPHDTKWYQKILTDNHTEWYQMVPNVSFEASLFANLLREAHASMTGYDEF